MLFGVWFKTQGLVPLELEEAVRAEVRDLVGDTKGKLPRERMSMCSLLKQCMAA